MKDSFEDTISNNTVIEKTTLPAQITITGRTSSINSIDSLLLISQKINHINNLLDKANYSTAYATLQEAYSICPKKSKIKKILLDIIQARIRLNFYNDNQTIFLLNKTDSIVRNLNNDSLLVLHLNNLGVYHYKWNKSSKQTKMYFKQALEVSERLNLKKEVAEILNNMAVSSDNPDEAIQYLKRAIEINSNSNNTVLLAINYLNIGLKHIGINNREKALLFLSQAENIVKKDSLHQIIPILYENKAKIYSKMGKNKEAYDFLSKAIKLSKNSSQRNYIRNMEYIATQNNLSEKLLQLKLMKNEYQIKILNRNTIFTIIIIFILIVLIFMIVRYYKNTQRIYELQAKNKIKEQNLKHNKKELINMATFIKTRHNVLENIYTEVSKLQNEKSFTLQNVKKIKFYVKNLMNEKNKDIQTIQQRINAINKEFIKRLEKLHPNLTKNDKKIAVFLRANLTTKQIAVILNISPSSVNIARYRMRQHLNIDNSINLVSYIKKI